MEYTEPLKYQVFNFHPVETIEAVKTWLHADTSKPLVLTGEAQTGRNYVLQAACFAETRHNLPYRVIPIDHGEFHGDLKQIAHFIDNAHPVNQRDAGQWHDLVEQMSDVADLNLPPFHGFGIVLKLTAVLDLVKTVSTFFQDYRVKLPATDAVTFLQDAIELAAGKYNLVFHLQNVEADPHTLSLWQDITQTLDLISLQENNDSHGTGTSGRVLLAVSMHQDVQYADAMGREGQDIGQIDLRPYDEHRLRQVFTERFENNNFSDEFIRLLLWQGELDDGMMTVLPSQLVNPMFKLFQQSIVQRMKNGWVLNAPTDVRLNSILGAPLRIFLKERQATIPESLKSRVREFMQLAALCGPWIPQQPLLEAMGIQESDQQDDILDAIESAFVECEPPLLKDLAYSHPGFGNIAVYSPLYPVLGFQYLKDWSGEERQQKAKELLNHLSGIYPLSNSTFAGVYWNIASHSDSATRQQWREKLHWYMDYLSATFFKKWLAKGLETGLVRPEQMILQAAKREISPTGKIFLDAVMDVCNHYFDTHDGYPLTNDLAASLNNVGGTYGALGVHQQALEYVLQAMEIRKAVLPENHPDLAQSLNNVGMIYSELGYHQQALEYVLKAIKIWKAVLPENHPDMALSLNNVGRAYSGLGDHQQALKYVLQAMEIRKAVLPENHPHLATSLNNVGSTYEALGDHQQAAEYHRLASDIKKARVKGPGGRNPIS